MAKYQNWPISKWLQMLSSLEKGLTYIVKSRIVYII